MDSDYELADYIEYHLDPSCDMVSIRDFNAVMGSNIEENDKVEAAIVLARDQWGPNDFIPPQVIQQQTVLDEISNLMKIRPSSKKKKSKAKKKIKGSKVKKGKAALKKGAKKLMGKAKGLLGKSSKKLQKSIVKKKSDVDKAQIKVDSLQKKVDKECDKLKKKDPEAHGKLGQCKPKLMSLDLEDELIEDEYEDMCDKCGKTPDVCDHEFEDKLDAVSIEDAQTLQHLVAFKSKCNDIQDRMMKGKGRYIQQLKAYVSGDNTAEVRMFNGKKVKVSSLNPNKDSLRTLFATFPSGPHIVECD
ncbi:MAG: hypothetical protein CMC93_05385 [Flavobacteriaceae bacterium]|nr:hypothetical protein [Flavobacteriaceae bacterium]|tara:strand:+ start:2672 stop:3577 length:906 start_codon:yes stop_codon:yes gene_type:complete